MFDPDNHDFNPLVHASSDEMFYYFLDKGIDVTSDTSDHEPLIAFIHHNELDFLYQLIKYMDSAESREDREAFFDQVEEYKELIEEFFNNKFSRDSEQFKFLNKIGLAINPK